MNDATPAIAITDAEPGRSVAAIKRQPIITQDAVPVLDTAKFEHMQRIALTIGQSSLTPKHLKGGDDRVTVANCFRVVNQAVRWGFDPFAVIDETYVVHGKLGYQGKLVAAVVNAKAGLKQRLAYTYNDKTGDDLEIVVSGTFLGEDTERTVKVRVGDSKTDNGMWTKDPRQKLIYTGATKWARAHCPELILGLLTDDDLERIAGDHATDVTPPRPERIEATEPVGPTFEVTDFEGVVSEHKDATKAYEHILRELSAGADQRGQKGLDGAWENNSVTVGAIREAGHADLADALREHFTARSEQLAAAAKKPAEAAKPKAEGEKPVPSKSDAPPSPLSLSGKAREAAWPAFTAWLAREIERRPKAERAEFLSQHSKEWAEICKLRVGDVDKINAAMDAPEPVSAQAAE